MKNTNLVYIVIGCIALAVALTVGASVVECVLVVFLLFVSWKYDFLDLKKCKKKDSENKKEKL